MTEREFFEEIKMKASQFGNQLTQHKLFNTKHKLFNGHNDLKSIAKND